MTPDRDRATDEASAAMAAVSAASVDVSVDVDEAASLAIEVLFEWYVMTFLGLELRPDLIQQPPSCLTERAIARPRLDPIRLWVEHWVVRVLWPEKVTDDDRARASENFVRVLRLAFDAVEEGRLSEIDLARWRAFRAIEFAMSAAELFRASRRAAGKPQ